MRWPSTAPISGGNRYYAYKGNFSNVIVSGGNVQIIIYRDDNWYTNLTVYNQPISSACAYYTYERTFIDTYEIANEYIYNY